VELERVLAQVDDAPAAAVVESRVLLASGEALP
jgi:hypothetical protein